MPTIKITEEHFSMLLRRAELHDDDAHVTINAAYHRVLLQASKEYEALRKALTVAGVSSENLETLIESQLDPDAFVSETTSPAKPGSELVVSPQKTRWTANAPVFVPNIGSPLNDGADGVKPIYGGPLTPPSFKFEEKDPPCEYETVANVANDRYEDEPECCSNDHQDRSIMIRGLSPSTTLADITKVVRGGIILNMYIRERDRTAFISFVEPLAAEKFVMDCQRNDLYLKGKRLDVTWAERQHYIPGYIQRQVYNQGATRNIVIRFAKKKMTEQAIRDDLEHIHRLEVVSISNTENHIFISTNGIQWAITARHCMQSRLKYRGTRIEFFEDECDQVLQPVERKIHKKREDNNQRPATVLITNRYAPLSDEANGSTDEQEKEKATKCSVAARGVKEPA